MAAFLFVYQSNFKGNALQNEISSSESDQLSHFESKVAPLLDPAPEMDPLMPLVPDQVFQAEFQSAATGRLFTGEKIRIFTDYLFRDVSKTRSFAGSSLENPSKRSCEKWGVMTTITSPPTEAIRRFLYREDWCVVVVADLNKPNVRFLDTEF